MKVQMNSEYDYLGMRAPGELVEVPPKVGARWLAMGLAREPDPEPPPQPAEPPWDESDEEQTDDPQHVAAPGDGPEDCA